MVRTHAVNTPDEPDDTLKHSEKFLRRVSIYRQLAEESFKGLMASFCPLFFRMHILFSCGHSTGPLVGRGLWTDLLQPPIWRVVPSPCRDNENGEDQAVGGLDRTHSLALAAVDSSTLWDPGCWKEGG